MTSDVKPATPPPTQKTDVPVLAKAKDEKVSSPVQGKKKKKRYSRQQKRERKAQQETQMSGRQEKRRHRAPNLVERIHGCFRNSQQTMSTAIEPSHRSDSMRIITCCNIHESRRKFPPDPYLVTTFRVQPLLVLDLNGVLCHRSRKDREPEGVKLRPSIGHVAGTPIIPRTDIARLLQLLEQYFCLAIWTSAKRKTARGLLELLVPPSIQERFLFVWTQSECNAVGNEKSDHDHEVVFEKHLPKIWKAFPLWNANNTLLIDDSPDKCPYALANAIHPPPINGQCRPANSCTEQQERHWRPDAFNEDFQYDFFQKLIHHWHTHPYEERLHPSNSNGQGKYNERMFNRGLFEHLDRFGSGHMGWRGTAQTNSWQESFSKAGPTRRAQDIWNKHH